MKRRVVAGTDETNTEPVPRDRDFTWPNLQNRGVGPVNVVLEKYTNEVFLSRLDDPIGFHRIIEGEAVRSERAYIQPATSHLIQHGLHIALLGPADVIVRVVDPPLLIGWVVPAGAVRHADQYFELFLVVGVSRDIHPHGANGDYFALPARDLPGQLYRRVAVGCRRYNGVIGSPTAGESRHRTRRILAARVNRHIDAHLSRCFDFRCVHVEAEYAAARTLEKLRCNEADQS